MSTKPSTHAEWDTNGTNLSPTTAGHKSDGWATNEIPTSAEFNHWQKQVSDWTKWLYDGDVSFNNLKVSGDVRWLGSNTPTAYQMTGDLVSLPTSATDGYHTLEIGPDALKTVTTAYILHGIAHDGVAGRELTLYWNGEYTKIRNGSSSANADESIWFPGVPADSDVLLGTSSLVRLQLRGSSGNFEWHVVSAVNVMVNKTFVIHASQAQVFPGGTNTYSSYGQIVFNDTNRVHAPVVLETGSIITGVAAQVNKTSDAGNTLTVELLAQGFSSLTPTSMGTGTDATNNPGFVSIPISGTLVIPVVATEGYNVQVGQSTAAASLDTLLSVNVDAYVRY